MFAEIFAKIVVITSKLNFFRISDIFRPVFGCFLPANTTNKNSLNYIEILPNHFFAILKVSRTVAFETETRPGTYEIETEKMRSRFAKKSGDMVSRLHHWLLASIAMKSPGTNCKTANRTNKCQVQNAAQANQCTRPGVGKLRPSDRKTISCGPPALAETPTHVEFYETFTIFIKTWNFENNLCFSSNYNCII